MKVQSVLILTCVKNVQKIPQRFFIVQCIIEPVLVLIAVNYYNTIKTLIKLICTFFTLKQNKVKINTVLKQDSCYSETRLYEDGRKSITRRCKQDLACFNNEVQVSFTHKNTHFTLS